LNEAWCGVSLLVRTIALCALLLLGSACDELFYVGLDATSTPDVPVFDYGHKEDLSGLAKLYGFSLEGRPLDTACWSTFWDIHVVEGRRYVEVDRLTYGQAPSGFNTTVNAAPLLAGYVYSGNGGFHGIGRDCYFEVTEDSLGAKHIRELTEAEFRSITSNGGG